jgi:formylglycine-generating enzyme required for sulfatase activity
MKPDHPVERVSYNDAVEFVSALNELSMKDDNKIQELLKDIIPDHRLGDKYDLPTEAQWEFVKRNRGNAKGLYFDRDDSSEMSLYAWWKENSGNQTHAVASLQPRMIDGMPFYDMEGNVWEKTKDTIRLGEPLLGGVDPLDTSGYWITFRGAAYNAYESLLQAGYRGDSSSRDGRLDSSGIRLVRTRE